MSRSPQYALGTDLCYCGDYLSQHADGGAGRCRVGSCDGNYSRGDRPGGCGRFRFSRRANEAEIAHWRVYHEIAWNLGDRA